MEIESELLTPDEVAKYLRVSKSQVLTFTRNKQLAHITLPTAGKGFKPRYRYVMKDIQKWVNSARR